MKQRYFVISMLICSLFFTYCAKPLEEEEVEEKVAEFAGPSARIYQVLAVNNAPLLTGQGSDTLWSQAQLLDDFVLPWQEKDPPYTAFRALYDEAFFYFKFEVEDPDLVLIEDSDTSIAVVASDRVELFFAGNDSLNPYYQLEMDPRTWVFDAKSHLYRKVDQNWEWKGMETFTSLSDTGYILEGRIPMSSFQDLGLWQDESQSTLLCGVFRAEFEYFTPDSVGRNWISWIVPQSPTPDFHIPSAFGRLQFK